jgi:hypothetical protein
LSFSTGVLVDEASGDIATEEGQASSNLASLNIAAGQFFTLTASAVGSKASVDGIPSATGSSTLADLVITVLGSSINIPLNPSPNDVIFDDFGVTVTPINKSTTLNAPSGKELLSTPSPSPSTSTSPSSA